MNSFDFDNVKAETARAMSRCNGLLSIAKMFRVIQLIPPLVFLAWTSSRVPFAVGISREFFAKLGSIVASPLFVFLLCNVIIATLLAKSGGSSAGNPGANNADAKLYEEVVKSSENSQSPFLGDKSALSMDEIVYQDKEMISQVNAIDSETQRNLATDRDSDTDMEMDNPKVHRRSKSEKLVRESAEKAKKELWRLETEKSGKFELCGEKLYLQDELSNEEFQQKIEEFIAKELKFRREESLAAIVLQSQA